MAMQKERHKAVWLRMLAVREIRMARDAARLLKSQSIEIAQAYTRGGHAEAEAKIGELGEKWLRVLIPNSTTTIRDFSNYLLEQLGQKSSKATFSDLTAQYISTRSLSAAKELTDTTKKILTQAILSGQEEGLGVNQIAKNIREAVGGDMGGRRARTIARTETHAAAGFGMQAQASDVEFPLKKIWVAVEDARTRETHTFVDGTELPLDDYFQVGNDQLLYPGDPNGSPEEIINCRCTLIYEPAGNLFSEATYE